jgi:hypothetical protein
MNEPTHSANAYDCCRPFAEAANGANSNTAANNPAAGSSFTSEARHKVSNTKIVTPGGFLLRYLHLAALSAIFLVSGGCGSDAPTSKPDPAAAAPKPAEPAVPDEMQAGASSLLGTETQVLVFGDLAKNGKQQFLAANVIPKTPKNNLPGTIVTRAIIAENQDGQWAEIFRCDEHLKNSKGYLGLTPLASVTGWRLQFEQDPTKGLTLYLTPLKGTDDPHVLPIGVRYNPATKRYQSLDRAYEHFLLESPVMSGTPRSTLR